MKENTNNSGIIIGSRNKKIQINIPLQLKHCLPSGCFFIKEIKEMTRNSGGNNDTTNITQNPQKGDIYNITTSKGDAIVNNNTEIAKLKAEIRLLNKLVESKNDQIKILEDTIELLKKTGNK